EDCVGWASETSPEVLLADAAAVVTPDEVQAWAERMTAPTLVIHGDDDRISPLTRAETLARVTGGELVVLEGSGHLPLVRDPVRVNLSVRGFVERLTAKQPTTARWTR